MSPQRENHDGENPDQHDHQDNNVPSNCRQPPAENGNGGGRDSIASTVAFLRADFRSRALAATEEVNTLIAGRETKHEANEGVLVYLGNMRGAVAEALLGLDARDVDMFRVLMFFDLQLAQEAELVLLQNEHIRADLHGGEAARPDP
jgi:hypothetical protein